MKDTVYHLIHANIAQARAALDDPIMAGFLALADEIDTLASNSPGFVTQPAPPDEGSVYTGMWLLNLSIWESLESLSQFTYQGGHAEALARRSEWFVQYGSPNYVLYWAPAGHIPGEREIKERIDHLAQHGATPYAFTFEEHFTVQEMLDAG